MTRITRGIFDSEILNMTGRAAKAEAMSISLG
jgi:hypothetical protein